MSAREKAAKMLASIKLSVTEESFQTRYLNVVDQIIEAAKEELDNSGEYVRINIEAGPFPRVPEPCEDCNPDDHAKLILVDKIGRGAKCLKCGKEVPCPCNPHAEPVPKLIQGYTAKQWTIIIDSGYLCEFNDGYNGYYTIDHLREFGCGLFKTASFAEFPVCRPARLKGIMRPIFVEPVKRTSLCVFFDANNKVLGKQRIRYNDKPKKATNYMEITDEKV